MNKDLINMLDKKHYMKKKYIAMWDITYYCNLNCSHCYNQEHVSKKNNKYLQLEQSLAIIDSLILDGFDEINLAGGEPLSVPYILKIVEHCLKNNKTISINSNGLLLNPHLAKSFSNLGFSKIAFSIAGLQEATNALIRGKGVLKKVKNNIQYFVNLLEQEGNSNNTSINLGLTSLNIDELSNLYTFCRELGVPAVSIHPILPAGAALNNINIIESDAVRILDGFETLIKGWDKDINLVLDTRPATAYYIIKKYHLKQQDIFADCPGGERNIYLKPDGSKLACKLQNLNKIIFADNETLPLSNSLQSFVEWKENVKKPIYCKSCKFIKVCKPCPLVERNGQPQECLVALNRNAEYDEWVLDEPLHKTSGVQINQADDGKKTIYLKNKRYHLSKIGWKVWQAIDEGITIRQISARIASDKSVDVCIHDIANFIHNLRKRGLAYLKNEITKQLQVQCYLICCAR